MKSRCIFSCTLNGAQELLKHISKYDTGDGFFVYNIISDLEMMLMLTSEELERCPIDEWVYKTWEYYE